MLGNEQQLITPNIDKNIVLEGLSRFVEFHQIDPNLIWEGQTEIAALGFLQKLEDVFGYCPSIQEINVILQISMAYDSKIKIQDLWKYGLWESQQISLKESTIQNPKKILKRPKTAMSIKKQKTENCPVQFSKVTGYNSKINSSYSRVLNNSRQRQKIMERQLSQQIQVNERQKKWEYLIKVGEMNSWVKKCEKPLEDSDMPKDKNGISEQLYRVENEDHELRIICQNHYNSGQVETLPLKVFDQRYQAMRKKHHPIEKTKNNMKGTMMMVLDSQDKLSKAKLYDKIHQRDQELNYVLLQVIRLKSLLQQQQSVLTECKINLQ